MGRINLSALRVRSHAVQKFIAMEAHGHPLSASTEALVDMPPAQILTRQQPVQHMIPQIRTRTLPGNKSQQYIETTPTASSSRSRRPGKKSSRMYAPVEIKYEEDELRRQFFQDHPWELARPRIVLETTGNQYADVDWSQGLKQKGIPLSGESVIQRQLWLLHNVPDMTISSSYDVARREFYMLRRAEETKRRIAIEEAQHTGAHWDKTATVWGMEIENGMYDNWSKWAAEDVAGLSQRNSAFSGQTSPAEETELTGNEARPDVFGREAQRRSAFAPVEV